MAINTAYDQYAVAKGSLFVAPYLNGVLQAYRFLGNAPTVTLTPSTTTLDHVSSVSGLNLKDRSLTLTNDLAVAFTVDNMSAENKALWVGSSGVQTQTITAQTAQTLTIANPVLGGVYLFGVSPVVPAGVKDVTVASVTQGGGPLAAGTDYSVNGRTGMLGILPGGTVVAGTPITVSWSSTAATRTVINNQAMIPTVAMRFESLNPDTGLGNNNEEHFLPYVTLRPTGDLPLVSDIWQSIGFTGEVLQRSDIAGNPIARHQITSLSS